MFRMVMGIVTLLHLQISDGGQFYHETNPENIIVEPWNAFSSLFIALPAVYWAFKTHREIDKYRFLWFCIPLMFLNGMGSTLFHAFRISVFFLWMDVFPAAVLTLGVSLYFWYKVLKNPWLVVFIVLPLFLSRYLAHEVFDPQVAVNVSYAVGGTLLFLPIVIYLRMNRYHYAADIFLSIGCLITALVFRTIDKMELLPLAMGTHFLWHVFSGIGGHYLAKYLYKMKQDEIPAEKIEDFVLKK